MNRGRGGDVLRWEGDEGGHEQREGGDVLKWERDEVGDASSLREECDLNVGIL